MIWLSFVELDIQTCVVSNCCTSGSIVLNPQWFAQLRISQLSFISTTTDGASKLTALTLWYRPCPFNSLCVRRTNKIIIIKYCNKHLTSAWQNISVLVRNHFSTKVDNFNRFSETFQLFFAISQALVSSVDIASFMSSGSFFNIWNTWYLIETILICYKFDCKFSRYLPAVDGHRWLYCKYNYTQLYIIIL